MSSDPSQPYKPIGPGSSGSGFEIGTTPGEETRSAGDPLPCRLCGAVPSRVETYMWVTSFFLLTRHAQYQDRLCRACATKTGLRELGKSALLGWWGIPWGLLTLQALWINTRALFRWSKIPRAAVVGLVLFAFALPASVAYLLASGDGGSSPPARATGGNFVPDEVANLVEQGHRLRDQGKLDQALARYREAYRRAPGSSVINHSVAAVLIDKGELDQALPYSQKAVELEPDSTAVLAQNAWLLTTVRGPAAARRVVEKLRRRAPETVGDAEFMVACFEAADLWQPVLTTANKGLALSPDDNFLKGRRARALLELDHADEAAAAVAGFTDKDLTSPDLVLVRNLVAMRQEPLEETPRLTARWAESGYQASVMKAFVRAADHSGHGAEVRRRVQEWLLRPQAPGNAWSAARPWFADDAAWTTALDRRLARRPEVVPGFFRLQLYDPVKEATAVRRLGERLQGLDHPLRPFVDTFYFEVGLRERSWEERQRALAAHLERHGDHTLCRAFFAFLMAAERPEAAIEEAHEAERAATAAGEPALAATARLAEAEALTALGRLDEAARSLGSLDPGSVTPYADRGAVEVVKAEVAFERRDVAAFRNHLARSLASNDAETRAAGLVLKWSNELATRRPLTYRADVDAWLQGIDERTRSSTSASAQALLLAEGRVEPAWAERAVREEARGTFDLVRLVRRSAQAGRVDEAGLSRIAGGRFPGEWASRLARTVLSRRSS